MYVTYSYGKYNILIYTFKVSVEKCHKPQNLCVEKCHKLSELLQNALLNVEKINSRYQKHQGDAC